MRKSLAALVGTHKLVCSTSNHDIVKVQLLLQLRQHGTNPADAGPIYSKRVRSALFPGVFVLTAT